MARQGEMRRDEARHTLNPHVSSLVKIYLYVKKDTLVKPKMAKIAFLAKYYLFHRICLRILIFRYRDKFEDITEVLSPYEG